MNFGLVVLVLGSLPMAVELLKRRLALPEELLRKIVHVGSALLVAPLPLVLSYRQITALGLLFAVVMAVSRNRGIFTAIHGVERRTHGEVLFPLGIAVLALLFPHATPFVYGVFVVGLADGLAAPVGMRYGRRKVPGGKSVWGSATFFAICLAAGLAVLLAAGTEPVVALGSALAASVGLSAAEAVLRRGYDNLVLPALAGLMIGSL